MQKVYNDPTIPWKSTSFAVAADSADTVGIDAIINPPAEEIIDQVQDTTK